MNQRPGWRGGVLSPLALLVMLSTARCGGTSAASDASVSVDAAVEVVSEASVDAAPRVDVPPATDASPDALDAPAATDASLDAPAATDASSDAPSANGEPVPRGIFALGAPRDMPTTPVDERLSAIRDFDFLSGYTLRLFWRDLNPAQGTFDFAVVDATLARLAMNTHATRLNIEIIAPELPAWVPPLAETSAGGAGTWMHFQGGLQPVPWDAAAQRAWADLMRALATHSVRNAATGMMVPFSEHPALVSVDCEVVGIGGIRDNSGASQPTPLSRHPGYQRQRFIDATLASLSAARTAFPHRLGFLAYFSMTDGQDASFGGTTLDRALIGAITTAYNHPGQPSLAFFQELLSDVAPATTSILGQNLTSARLVGAPIMFQALTSWLHPFTGTPAAVASRNPATGIERGVTNWGARFFELYVSDLDDANTGAVDAMGRSIASDLRRWNSTL